MTSLLHHNRGLQLCWAFIAALSLAAILGCQRAGERKAGAPAQQKQISTPKPSTVETPVNELPKVETPVQSLPGPDQAKEPPAKKPAAPKSSAVKAPAAGKLAANSLAVGEQTKETMKPTVTWMLKPATDNPAAEAADQKGMKAYTEIIPNTDVSFDMAPIPGGVFKMGSPANEKKRKADEGPQVEIKIEPFWMEKHETTWNEYELWGLGLDKERRRFKQNTPSPWDTTADAVTIPTKPYSDMTFGMGRDGFPAVCMTQFAAKMYCKWLSAKTGHYYRLPTEAEWEYACRAGTKTAYSFGDDPKKLGDYAWYEGNSEEKYHKVGKKKPNPWGLYDMQGNVAEWCVDEYVPDRYKQLAGKVSDNPFTTVTKSYPQVVRGGAWTDEAPALRSAARRGSSKDWKQQDPQLPQSIWYHTDANFAGFRVVRPLRLPTPEEAARYEITEFEKEELIDYQKSHAGKQ